MHTQTHIQAHTHVLTHTTHTRASSLHFHHCLLPQVFLNEACKLYTVDVQMAWIHVENGKNLMEIPYLNRQRPR